MTFQSAGAITSAAMLLSALHAIGAAPQTLASNAVTQPAAAGGDTYAGSAACRRCHTATYERWSKTLMANVITDPRTRPEMILPDFSKPDPLLTFTRVEV